MSKIAQAEYRVFARAVRTRSQIAERERFIQYRAKARFQALLRRRRFSRQRKEHRDFCFAVQIYILFMRGKWL